MADEEVSTPSPLITDFLGSETVILYVGPKRKAFTVHKTLLSQSCDFFKAGFDGRFREGEEGVMYMPEDSPGAVALFVHWLYSKNVQATNIKSRLHETYDLHFLAIKLMIVELMDRSMDAIQNSCYIYNIPMTLGLLATIFEKTPTNSPTRDFGINWYCFNIFFSHRQTILADCAGCGDCEDDHKEEKGRPTRYVRWLSCIGSNYELYKFNPRELDEIWQATRSNSNSEMFQELISESQHDWANEGIVNPAYSNSPRDPNDNDCDYHSHGSDVPCYVTSHVSAPNTGNVARDSWLQPKSN